jgi:hypothetical protein
MFGPMSPRLFGGQWEEEAVIVTSEEMDDEIARLQEAVTLVARDLDISVRNEHGFGIVRERNSGLLYIGLEDGRYWSGGTPLSANTDADAVYAVATGFQDCVMEVLGTLWPECPLHKYGLHVRTHADEVVWSCEGAERHIVAAVGSLPGLDSAPETRPGHPDDGG